MRKRSYHHRNCETCEKQLDCIESPFECLIEAEKFKTSLGGPPFSRQTLREHCKDIDVLFRCPYCFRYFWSRGKSKCGINGIHFNSSEEPEYSYYANELTCVELVCTKCQKTFVVSFSWLECRFCKKRTPLESCLCFTKKVIRLKRPKFEQLFHLIPMYWRWSTPTGR